MQKLVAIFIIVSCLGPIVALLVYCIYKGFF
jgi:hypothetical protein